MSLRRYILGTVTANLALVGALLWQTARPSAPVTRARLAVTTQVSTEVANEPPVPQPMVKAAVSPSFHWSQIESTNHLVTLTNLLAIGCPKETVRDILDARVADDFRARLRELTRPAQARFWDVIAEGNDVEDLIEDTPIEKVVAELLAERERVQDELETVLSRDSQEETPSRNEWVAHLSNEKQTALDALARRHAKELEAWKQNAEKTPAVDRPAREKEMQARQEAEHRSVFSDAEWAEDELRRSPQAQRVRELRGFTATPEELRALAIALREFDSANPIPAPRDPSRPMADAAWKARREQLAPLEAAALTARLGAAGFAAFERGSDPRFHTLLQLARRLDQPPATAVQWLELQSAAQDHARLIRGNAGFDENTRAAALNAIRAETERTLRNAVGERGWGGYQRAAGEWLKQLNE
jgi:hypothetical protein